MNQQSRPRAPDVGLVEMTREGWFNGATGELLAGVRVTAEDTVIDVGCGDGGLIRFCARQGAEVLFIDRDPGRLAGTEQAVRDAGTQKFRAILSDCDPIPLDEATGDLVICTEVLEHVADPVQFLNELIRVTRPGGRLLVTVPDARSERLAAATAPAGYFQEPFHIRIFSAQEFRDLVVGAGLQIESQRSFGCFWSMYLALSWLTAAPGPDIPIDNPHPITDHWARLWQEVQRHPQGDSVRAAFNELLPRTQAIVARRPL